MLAVFITGLAAFWVGWALGNTFGSTRADKRLTDICEEARRAVRALEQEGNGDKPGRQ